MPPKCFQLPTNLNLHNSVQMNHCTNFRPSLRILTNLSLLMIISMLFVAAVGSQDVILSYKSRNRRELSIFDDIPPNRPTTIRKNHNRGIKPSFDILATKPKVTVLLGNTAYLRCRVRNIGQETVSWVRQKDYTILTVDTYTHTSDVRFRSIHPQGSQDWTLEISYTRKEDEGTYECHVSSEEIIRHEVQLEISTAKARISGDSELHIKTGNTITLSCEITDTKTPPVYAFWYKGNDVINYDSLKRSGISLERQSKTLATSNLRIAQARPEDSGNYSCKPSFTEPSSIYVHVINEEEVPAAMQYEKKSSSSCCTKLTAVLSVICIILQTLALR